MYKLAPYAIRTNWMYDNHPSQLVGQLEIGNDTLDGRTVIIRGKSCIHFGNASYLGLDVDQRMKDAAKTAIDHFGTQFSSSRSFIRIKLYEELEEKLQQIFGRPVVVTPTTTLAHLSFLPLFVQPDDLIIIDYLAHASLQSMIKVPHAQGTEVAYVRHNDVADLSATIEKYAKVKTRIWYVADSIYSMYGDTMPYEALNKLMQQYDNLYLYIDDAHGTAWCGTHGQGYALEHLEMSDRIVIAGSLNKAFGAGGGVLILPNQQMRTWVKRCGGSLVFSGPLQPAQLGAGLAASDILLSDEHPKRQAKLNKLIDTFIQTSIQLNLPLADYSHTPVFFVEVGPMNAGFTLCDMLIEAGFYMNLGVFPAVPLNRTGLRFSLSHHLEEADIKAVLRVVAECLPLAYQRHNTDLSTVRRRFYELNER